MQHKFAVIIFAIVVFVVLATPALAHPATGIVRDRAGNVFFSDLETVWKLDPQGKLTVFRAGVGGRHVHELSIDADDNIYGADISYVAEEWVSDVWKMTPNGDLIYLLAPTTSPPRGMSNWLDTRGNMYTVDQNNHLKKQTLLLRRSPNGQVSTLAGSAYGQQDGKGSAARFSSIGGMAFGPDGSLYLSDGAAVRKVTMDGTVTTVAGNLINRTNEDRPALFGGSYGSLSGLTVDAAGNVYVADAGNRRLLKIDGQGKVQVVLRSDPPYFPSGVVTAPNGDIYLLEVGFTLPSSWSGPRVRRIAAEGTNTILATIGSDSAGDNVKAVVARDVGRSTESFLSFFIVGERVKYATIILSVTLLTGIVTVWRRRRRRV